MKDLSKEAMCEGGGIMGTRVFRTFCNNFENNHFII